jgi:hypothetical protein
VFFRNVGTHQPVCTVSWPDSSQYGPPPSTQWILQITEVCLCFFSYTLPLATTVLPAVRNSSALVTGSVSTKCLNQNNIPFVISTKCFETALYQEEKSRLLTRDTTYDGSRDYPLIWGFGGGGATAPQWARAFSFVRFLDHTQWRITVGRTPLDEWSARRRDLNLTTQTTFTTDKHRCPRWDSNPQSQQASGRRPTP